jgi:exodeoxyribonuclease V alpha subunit
MSDNTADLEPKPLEPAPLRPIDRHFAQCVSELFAEQDPLTLSLFAWVSYQLGMGHSCVRLAALPPALAVRSSEEWQQRLRCSKAVQDLSLLSKQSVFHPASFSAQGKPLVMEGEGLYLSRYHRYEWQVTDGIRSRLGTVPIDQQALISQMDILFGPLVTDTGPNSDPNKPKSSRDINGNSDWQRIAVAGAACRRFSVISGGPGTGKTTTVAKLLAVLIGLNPDVPPPRIALCAPTGKAAARLADSIKNAKLKLPPYLADHIPEDSATLHRLLGVRSSTEGFYHNADNPLHYDWVLVDEASMVDLPLMAHLMEALRPEAGLILIGDRNQLASVEAGSVLGDICDTGQAPVYSYAMEQHLALCAGFIPEHSAREQAHESVAQTAVDTLANSLFELKHSYRFRADSGIGLIAKAMQTKDVNGLRRWLQQEQQRAAHMLVNKDTAAGPFTDVDCCFTGAGFRDSQVVKRFLSVVTLGYAAFLDAVKQQASPLAVIQAFQQFQVLSALRENDGGVVALNHLMEQHFSQQGLLKAETDQWYPGRAIMVTANDYGQHLFNGDIGICLPSVEDPSLLRLYFETQAKQVRAVLPSRLPKHETVFAMTIHKSQGSEFDHVAMVLPAVFSPIMTRELVYTGVTRARQHLSLFIDTKTLLKAVQTDVQRESGLRDRLWRSNSSNKG